MHANSSLLTRLTGIAVLLIAAIAWPMAALAADPAVETQSDPAIVFIVLSLLFAALMSGIFFASPLRGRLLPSTAAPARRSRPVTQPPLDEALVYAPQSDQPMHTPQPTQQPIYPLQQLMQPPVQQTQPPQLWPAQPQIAPPGPPPAPAPQPQSPYPPAPASPLASPSTSPWSTGAPQPTGRWGHGRRDPGAGQG